MISKKKCTINSKVITKIRKQKAIANKLTKKDKIESQKIFM